jgi:hypothetical protein
MRGRQLGDERCELRLCGCPRTCCGSHAVHSGALRQSTRCSQGTRLRPGFYVQTRHGWKVMKRLAESNVPEDAAHRPWKNEVRLHTSLSHGFQNFHRFLIERHIMIRVGFHASGRDNPDPRLVINLRPRAPRASDDRVLVKMMIRRQSAVALLRERSSAMIAGYSWPWITANTAEMRNTEFHGSSSFYMPVSSHVRTRANIGEHRFGGHFLRHSLPSTCGSEP